LRAPHSWDESSAIDPPVRDVIGEDAVQLPQMALPVGHRAGGTRAKVRSAVNTSSVTGLDATSRRRQ